MRVLSRMAVPGVLLATALLYLGAAPGPRFLVAAGSQEGSLQGSEGERVLRPAADSPHLDDLRTLLDTGVVIQDRNGDGVADFLHVRLLLPRASGEAEVTAAANVAARLGFETSATDLGLAETVDPGATYDEPVILVGALAMEASGAASELQELREALAPGQGLLLHLPAGERFRTGGVGLLGYDATGLLAAAEYLSSRYPAVWDPEGAGWREVAETVEDFLADRDWSDADVSLNRIVVERGRPGVARARITVDLPATVDLQEVVRAFEGPDTVLPGTTVDTGGGASTGDTVRGEPTPLEPSSLEFRDLHRLDIRLTSATESRTLPLRPRELWDTREDPAFRVGPDAEFSLADLYRVGGLFRDTNQDLVPDESSAFLSLDGSGAAGAVVDLATRLGLETAGLRLPLARVDAQEDDPSALGFPVLVGTDHYQIRRLREQGDLPGTELAPEEGFVQFVEGGFGERNALAVGGADDEGLEAATRWLARRAPFLWRYGKGEYRLADAQRAVRRFLQAKSESGQVALALTKLESWLGRMEEDPPERIQVELATREAPEELEELVEAMVRRRFPGSQVAVRSWPTGFGVGDTIFAQEWNLPWEVDEAREILESEVYPRLRPGGGATVELRLSEPPEIRTALEEEIRESLRDRGIEDGEVHVLSAYKQGYSWIHDALLPRLRDRGVAAIDLTYHTLEESDEIRWQTIAAETRWLQEVYPFDAVLARELGISDTAVVFHPTRRKDPIYTFEARDTAGAVVLRETFNPHYVVRPFFELFPEYEQVRVTTGWMTASQGADTLVDRRVVTDPERFWNRLQTETYSEIIEYIMDSQDGDPAQDNAPFFDEFRVDLRLSEPDYRIGIDEETISSLEALHEDIFFETHTLFSLLGARYQTSLRYPGRVLPFVDPSGAGEPGWARLSLTGKSRGAPELVLRTWQEGNPEPLYRQYGLGELPTEVPKLTGVVVADGDQGLRRIQLKVTVPDSVDRYQEFKDRSSEARIDQQFLNVELLEGMIASLRQLHDGGVMEEVLSWDRVDELALDFRLEDDSTYQRTVVLPRSTRPGSTDNPRLRAPGWRYDGQRLAQWETPMPPEESDSILARLATFPGVTAYYLTDSYLGHRVWAADFLLPQEAEYVSQAKLNALKPTLFVSGREHANEVSSTNHILRLGELLVTDSAYRALLDRVNVVLHPVANPDGAALAYRRQLVNPDHMLHAARPGALGVDATAGGWSEDPVYPEARARPMIREAWLPDIYLNPHGYPSHEWVQYFAGYSAWVRGRQVGPRDWWVPRGWFIPGFRWVEDDEHPEYKEAQFAILDSMAAAMTADPEMDAVNRRLYARYKKYGEQDRDGFTEYHYKGMAVNMALRGRESIGTGVTSPRITYFGVTTEAPDETARGEWMQLMGTMGLAHTSAALRYLARGEYEVEREAQAFREGVVRKVYRLRPVLPPEEEEGVSASETSTLSTRLPSMSTTSKRSPFQ